MYKIVFLFSFMAIISCSGGSHSESNNPFLSKDSAKIKKGGIVMPSDNVVLNFMKWYRDNFDKLNQFYLMSDNDDSTHMINGKWGDSTVYYTVNFKGTEKFLEVLNSSGFLSKKYIDNKRKSIRERSIELANAKQSDGPPDGFSAEEIFYLNDIEEYFPLLNKAKVTQFEHNDRFAIYKIDLFEYIEFKLSKYGDKWMIDEIRIME
jgi:hypothetical protein